MIVDAHSRRSPSINGWILTAARRAICRLTRSGGAAHADYDPRQPTKAARRRAHLQPRQLFTLRDDGIQPFARAGNTERIVVAKLPAIALDLRTYIALASSSNPGLLRQLSGTATEYLDGSGNWSVHRRQWDGWRRRAGQLRMSPPSSPPTPRYPMSTTRLPPSAPPPNSARPSA